ncbi:MAG: hypothetical protein DMG34_23055 [Acidobacteria bacterium]|nr:MAG: hypothetical protein DMG34_23055 [Acidobacteriota bacterium]
MGVAAPSTLRLTGQRLQTTADLTPGQEVLAEITGNIAVANDGNPSFTTVKLLLASSQIAGPVAAVNSSAGSFALTNIWSLFTKANPAVTQLEVQTGTQITFVDLTPADASAISTSSKVAVKGPLFNTIGSVGQPTLSALQVAGR